MTSLDNYIEKISWQTQYQTLLSAKDLAKLLQVHLGTIYNMRKKNNGPSYFFIGKKIMYEKKEVIEWLKKNQRRDNAI